VAPAADEMIRAADEALAAPRRAAENLQPACRASVFQPNAAPTGPTTEPFAQLTMASHLVSSTRSA
jgi:hypothetical protein